MEMQRLLKAAVQFNASDLHIQVGSPPMVRVDGVMTAMNLPAVSAEEIRELAGQVADKTQLERIDNERSSDFSYSLPDTARFRINVFYEQGRLCLVARSVPLKIKQFAELFLPPVIQDIAEETRGLVLITGTTGSGKSTTLAAIIDHLNRNHRLRIITIEDPIEFVHTSQKCLIAQREIGSDSPSFAEALRRALRQDPDVILVGELRDLETMRIALQAADTGHLVFSTVHTTNAALNGAATGRHVSGQRARTAADPAFHQFIGRSQPAIGQKQGEGADSGGGDHAQHAGRPQGDTRSPRFQPAAGHRKPRQRHAAFRPTPGRSLSPGRHLGHRSTASGNESGRRGPGHERHHHDGHRGGTGSVKNARN